LHTALVARIALYNRTASRVKNLSKLFNFIHIASDALNQPKSYDIIVNTIPVSGQQSGAHAFLLDQWLPISLCYDISYAKNGLTPFILTAQRHGIQACDGLGMLVEQAAEAFFDWHGILPETQSVLRTLRA
jgi:shikimate dehydrogenase